MIVLSVSGVTKAYGTDVILKDISFHVNEGDRVGIIGGNGAGKTTLMNILAGRLSPDEGDVFVSGDTTVGYLAQRDEFNSEKTVIEEVEEIFRPLALMEQEMEELNHRIAEAGPAEQSALWNRLTKLQEEFDRKGGYTYKSEMNGILSSMAFGEEYYGQRTDSLSGGERTRLALACLLMKKPDLLMMDEPTNHLDIGTLKWLEQYLRNYRGTLLVISHDRYFLDQSVNRIFEVEDLGLKCYNGNYTAYAEQKKADREAALRAYNKQQTEIKRQEDLIRRYKERGTEKLAKRAASREKRLEHVDRLDRPKGDKRSIKIDFKQDLKSGNDVLIGEDISKRFGARELFRNVSFDIKRGERICIVGANGIGKTSLLRIMTGLDTAFTGYLKLGQNVEFGYYDQGQQLLDDSVSVLEEIHRDHRLETEGALRNILARFLFTGEMVFRTVGDLSGGEKARLALLKLMMSGANCLVLDEPTNHLDIASKEAFEEALGDYPGTVIVVTHDRYFLNRIPDRILELTEDGLAEYLGRYDYYVNKKEELASGKAYLQDMKKKSSAVSANAGGEEDEAAKAPENLSAREMREIKKKQEAEERRLKREAERLEKLIEDLETEIAEIQEKMSDPALASDHVKLGRLAEQMEEKRKELDLAYEKWYGI